MGLSLDFFKYLFHSFLIVTNVTMFSFMFKLIQKLVALQQYTETIVVFACVNVLGSEKEWQTLAFSPSFKLSHQPRLCIKTLQQLTEWHQERRICISYYADKINKLQRTINLTNLIYLNQINMLIWKHQILRHIARKGKQRNYYCVIIMSSRVDNLARFMIVGRMRISGIISKTCLNKIHKLPRIISRQSLQHRDNI